MLEMPVRFEFYKLRDLLIKTMETELQKVFRLLVADFLFQ
jgi:hypothetical protein